MRVVVALGGNALLRRGEPATAERQRANVAVACAALAPAARTNQLVITHGNGPQVGLLALQATALAGAEATPLDILDAESEGMIGYLIEQELEALLGGRPEIASLLTIVEVEQADPAFARPTKPIGPIYAADEAARIEAARGWTFVADGDGRRRVVPSPRPRRIVSLLPIEALLEYGCVVICGGGGGIPAVRAPTGRLVGIEGVIDKDRVSALLARELRADALVIATDVDAVYVDWGTPAARPLHRTTPAELRALPLAEGSMGPKVEAACDFVEATGALAVIGALTELPALLAGTAGTVVRSDDLAAGGGPA